MVSNAGVTAAAAPLPWLEAPLREALATRRGHALLIHGPQGVGQFDLALTLAQAWLCEGGEAAERPCGGCASCTLVRARSHPDLMVLLPEALRESLGFDAGGDDDAGGDEKPGKRKPSKDIRVDEIRRAIGFAQTTSARGRGKVIVIHPAERMNPIAANALLKTLEEPPGAARLLLGCAAPDVLLPTIRSRCQPLPLALPDTALATAWLAEHSVARADVMLAAAGGQPQDALAWVQDGIDAKQWLALPLQIARGEVGTLASWPLPRVIEMLQKLCHDAMRLAAGGEPRYFPASALPPPARLESLSAWALELARTAEFAEHPFNAGLMVESLTDRARCALAPVPER